MDHQVPLAPVMLLPTQVWVAGVTRPSSCSSCSRQDSLRWAGVPRRRREAGDFGFVSLRSQVASMVGLLFEKPCSVGTRDTPRTPGTGAYPRALAPYEG